MYKFVFFYLLLTVGAYGESIVIDNPKSGWRDSSKDKVMFMQEVNYPDARVSTQAGQPKSGVIEGRILGNINNNKKPLTLVVNGNPMPLKTSQGKFSRPYSFGRGSNSVEIINSDGSNRQRVQFYDNKVGGSPVRIRVILSWDSDGTDLDLHVISPDGAHCYYGNRLLADGSSLDVDVTTGYGPEIYASPGANKGPYLIYVNYYGRSTNDLITTVTTTIITNEGTPDEKVEVKRVPLRHPGEISYVGSFVYN